MHLKCVLSTIWIQLLKWFIHIIQLNRWDFTKSLFCYMKKQTSLLMRYSKISWHFLMLTWFLRLEHKPPVWLLDNNNRLVLTRHIQFVVFFFLKFGGVVKCQYLGVARNSNQWRTRREDRGPIKIYKNLKMLFLHFPRVLKINVNILTISLVFCLDPTASVYVMGWTSSEKRYKFDVLYRRSRNKPMDWRGVDYIVTM